MIFWFLWSIDAVVAAIVVYFFIIGLADGSVSSFNMSLWLIILTIITVLLFGSYMLRGLGRELLAATLLGIVAVPGILASLFFLIVLIMNPKWN